MPPLASRRPACLVTLAVFSFLFAHPATSLARTYRAERYDVRLSIGRDGSLEVTERTRFVFDGPGEPFTRVYRDIPTTRTDGIDVLAVTLDGQPLPLEGPAVSVAPGDGRLRVEVRFAPLEQGRHEVGLRYRARHVVFRDGDTGQLRWTPVPDRRGYLVEASTVEIVWPALAEGPLGVRTRRDDGVSVVVARRADAVTIETADLRPNRTYQVRLELPASALAPDLPQWQAAAAQREALRRERMALGGVAWGLVALGFLLVWRRHRPTGGEHHRTVTSTGAPPSELPVAAACALLRHGQVMPADFTATVVDLARQGFLKIEHTGEGGTAAHRVSRTPRGLPSHDHEREALDLLFPTGRRGAAEAPYDAAVAAALQGLAPFKDAVRRELLRGGWLDEQRLQVRRAMVRAALFTLLGGALVAGIVLVAAGDAETRHWAWVPGGIALGGVVGLLVGGATSPLSDRGAAEAGRWQAYERALAAAARRPTPAAGLDWGRALPFAVATGLAATLAARADAFGLATPAWFAPGRRGEDAGSFQTWLASAGTTSSGDSSSSTVATGDGGASGGGCDGGGGSGAD